MAATAFQQCIDHLSQGLLSVCIPGRLDGEPVVEVVAIPINENLKLIALCRDPDIRMIFLLSVTKKARQIAVDTGLDP